MFAHAHGLVKGPGLGVQPKIFMEGHLHGIILPHAATKDITLVKLY